MNMIAVWVFLAILFLVIELVTVGMVSIWLVAGSLAALLAAALRLPVWLQIVVFLLVSGACFALLYPRLKHLVGKNKQATNADMVLGQTAFVLRRIDNLAGTGAVTIGGKTWSARSADGSVIEVDTLVQIEKIQGVKLIVTPLPDRHG